MVIGWHLISVIVAAMPVVVAVEIMRDVAASRRLQVPLRTAVDQAVLKAAPAARWTLATLVATFVMGVGALLFALGVASVIPDMFDSSKIHDNPLALILPGAALMAIGLVVGCFVAPRAYRAIAHLHANVSSQR